MTGTGSDGGDRNFAVGGFVEHALFFLPIRRVGARRLFSGFWTFYKISMEPFRAFVADKLNESQRHRLLCSRFYRTRNSRKLCDYLNKLGVREMPKRHPAVFLLFVQGLCAMFLICVLYTVFTSKNILPKIWKSLTMKNEKRGPAIFSARFRCSERNAFNDEAARLVQFFVFFSGSDFLYVEFTCLTTAYRFMTRREKRIFDAARNGAADVCDYSIVCFAVAFACRRGEKYGHKKVHAPLYVRVWGSFDVSDELPNAISDEIGAASPGLRFWQCVCDMRLLPAAIMGVYMAYSFFYRIPEIVAHFFSVRVRAVFEKFTAGPLKL